jgi:linoleoyl-CoA desaturase
MRASDLRYQNLPEEPFVTALKQQTKAYFTSHAEHRLADGWVFFKSFGLLGIAGIAYMALLMSQNVVQVGLAYGVLMLAAMFLAVNVLHDAAHRALVRSTFWNRLINRVVSLPLGIDPDYWTVRHVQYHHAHPNVEGFDLDIEPNPFLRQTPFQRYAPRFRYQYIYWPLIAALSMPYINWVFDWSDRLGKTALKNEPVLQGIQGWVVFVVSKLAHLILFVWLPMHLLSVHGVSAWVVFSAYCLSQMVASFFVVALILGTHWAQVEFFQPNPSGVMPHSWRMHTLRTAVDWIPSWQWLGYWMGGLNLHVTHHLFPHVNHRHYPALARIVAMVARDYDLPYRQIDYPTLLRLQKQFLQEMGQAPNE